MVLDVNDGHDGVVEASLNRLSYSTGGWSCCGIAMASEVESYEGLMMEQRDRNEYGDGVILWMFSVFFSTSLLRCIGIFIVDMGSFRRCLEENGWRVG